MAKKMKKREVPIVLSVIVHPIVRKQTIASRYSSYQKDDFERVAALALKHASLARPGKEAGSWTIRLPEADRSGFFAKKTGNSTTLRKEEAAGVTLVIYQSEKTPTDFELVSIKAYPKLTRKIAMNNVIVLEQARKHMPL